MTTPEMDLSLCAICGDPAQFTDADPGAMPVSYCTKDLPLHFRGRAESGQLPLQTDETKDELMAVAQELDVEGRSTMTKAQLQSAVAAAKLTGVLDKERKDKEKAKDNVLPVEPNKDKDVDPKPEPAVEPDEEKDKDKDVAEPVAAPRSRKVTRRK